MKFCAFLTFLFSLLLASQTLAISLGFPLRAHVSNQLVVAIDSNNSPPLFPPLDELKQMGRDNSLLPQIEVILKRDLNPRSKSKKHYRQLLLITLADQSTAEAFSELLEKRSDVKWVSPNYLIEGDPREFNDVDLDDDAIAPQGDDEILHTIMQDQEAWKLSTGSGVTIAVTDDGVDFVHPDLQNSLWMNISEIPNNAVDDDGNGFIDDWHGWNFSDSDNNILPGKDAHGTFVSGLINASRDNFGITGTAPDAKIMGIKFIGGYQTWSSVQVARSYAYAVQNGAKIINTSYNIDTMIDDQVYLEAVRHAYDHGLLILNSAGNNRDNQPARVSIHQILLIAATDTAKRFRDQRSYFSNFGRGIDLSAPGNDLVSCQQGGSFEKNGGTSFSTPIAAAALALVWSYFPEYNRDQVWSRLTSLSDDIDPRHIDYYQGKMGAGRVNSFKALTGVVPPPQVRGLEQIKDDAPIAPIEELQLNLRHVFTPERSNFLQAAELINIESNEQISFSFATPYLLGTNVIKFKMNRQLPIGKYRFILHASKLKDPFGQMLDGNRDGIAGDDWMQEFTVALKGKEIIYDE